MKKGAEKSEKRSSLISQTFFNKPGEGLFSSSGEEKNPFFESNVIQLMPSGIASNSGRQVSDDVASKIGNMKGKGNPLSKEIEGEMGEALGSGFGDVRVHSDQQAVALNQELHSNAFTVGNDIFFNSGRYDPHSEKGKRLLAHELTHTLQQSGTSGRIQKEDGETADSQYGKFEAKHYHPVTQNSDGRKVGVMMYLKFHPGQNTDARQIGLVQVAQGKIEGKQIDEGRYGEKSANTGLGAGHFIDTVDDYPNPIYAAQNIPRPGEDPSKLKSYDTDTSSPSGMAGLTGITYAYSGGLNGYHFYDETSGIKVNERTQSAELYDHPLLYNLPNNSEQTFETAAIAIEGNDEGMYYGSVEWGYKKDGAGNFSVLPFKKKSKDVPSASFFTAVKIWNSIQFLTEKFLVDAVGVTFFIKNGPSISNLNKGTLLNAIQKGTDASTGVSFHEVTIMDGPYQGVRGYIKSESIKPILLDTVDLPITQTFKVADMAVLMDETKKTKAQLPSGTRVRVIDKQSSIQLSGMSKIEVLDGPFAGMVGIMASNFLEKEVLGEKV